MSKYLIAIAAALALTSGAALADASVSTKTTTSTSGDGASDYSTTTSKESMDDDGNVTKETRSYQSEPASGSRSTAVSTVNADGSKTTYEEEHTVTPVNGELVEKKTTTTTEVR
jgi:hypothetical protein